MRDVGVDQLHAPLGHFVASEELVVGRREHVDDGVADGDYVQGSRGDIGIRHGWDPTQGSPRQNSRRVPTDSLALMPKDAATETSTNPYRLPRTVVPVRYEVTLQPDLARALSSAR